MTLSNPINGVEIRDGGFSPIETALNNRPSKFRYQQFDVNKLDFTNAFAEDASSYEFTPDQDMRLVALGLSVYNPDATSRTITLTLESLIPNVVTGAIAVNNTYLGGSSVSISLTATSATLFHARQLYTSPLSFITLVAGIRHRIRLSSNVGTAVDRVQGILVAEVEDIR